MLLTWPEIVRITAQHLMDVSQYFVGELGMEEKQFEQVLMKSPKTLMYRVERLVSTNDFFLNKIGMERKRPDQSADAFPHVVGFSVERKLKPLVHYFHKVIRVPKENFSKRISDQLTVLGLSLKKIKERVKWLKTNLGLSQEGVCRLGSLSLYPLQLKLPTLKARVDNICEQFKRNRQHCASLLTHYPQLFTINIKNVNETLQYVVDVAQRDVKEVENYSQILWFSLDNRIRPRYERMISLDLPCDNYNLVTLFGIKDDAFKKLMERHARKVLEAPPS